MSRPLLPRPPDQPSSSASESKPRVSNKRRTVVAAACNACRLRRTKCDSNRPCRPCIVRNVVCEHETPMGVTKATHQRELLESLKTENSSMFEILRYLQNKTTPESQAFLNTIREQRPLDIGSLKHWISKQDGYVSTEIAASGSTTSQYRTPRGQDEPGDTLTSPVSENESQASSPGEMIHSFGKMESNPPPATKASFSESLIPISLLKQAVDAYYQLHGNLFRLHTTERVKQIQSSVFNHVRTPDKTTISEVINSQQSPEAKFRLAEVTGMASIGLLYLYVSKPNDLPPRMTLNVLQEYTKKILQEAIQVSSTKAVNLCGLLTMYCIVSKATVAMAYVEIGVGLGHNQGLSTVFKASKDVTEDFLESQRIWRTLLLCSAWLGATLDCVALAGTAALTMPMKQADDGEATKEMLKLVTIEIRTIKAKVFLVNNGDNVTNVALLEDLRLDLRQLYARLPMWMTLNYLRSRRGSKSVIQSVYYIHLFYLSALELLFRHAMVDESLFGSAAVANNSLSVLNVISEGVMAAKMAAKVLQLMKEEECLVQICWLCIFTSYTSCLILLYAAVQKILSGHLASDWNGEVEHAKAALACLGFSAEVDETAAAMHNVLACIIRLFEGELDGLLATVPSNKLASEHDSIAYLFIPNSGPSILEKLSRDLLRLIRQPFAPTLESNLLMPIQSISHSVYGPLENWMEASIGTPLVWSLDLQSGDVYTDTAPDSVLGHVNMDDITLLMPHE